MMSLRGPSPFCTGFRAAPLLVAGLLLAVLLPGCGKGQAGGAQKGRSAAAVTAGVSEQKNIPIDIRAVGSVEAWNTVQITPQVGGILLAVRFTEGQDVKQGDVLFEIDPAIYRAALNQALANLSRDIATAASAAADAERYGGLVDKGYVTKQQAGDMSTAAAAAAATVRADSALVDNARLDLSHCTVRAPISGRTGSLLVHAGNLVKANGDQPLVVINQISPVRVTFSVPESQFARIRRSEESKLAVEVSSPGDSVRVSGGTLTFVDNAVDPATATVLLKAAFPNLDHALWPGQFVNVTLRVGTLNGAVVVPASAVESGQQGDFVYVIQPDMTVKAVKVETGIQVDGFTVIDSGMVAGEKVVTDGQLRLVPGAKVDVQSAPADSARASNQAGTKVP
jgi:membrane fusion protein, multidrug efflux system